MTALTRECGNVDPHLNPAKEHSLARRGSPADDSSANAKLPDPVKGFKVGDTREKIQAFGEGKKIVVVANTIAVRKAT